jgi:hypothetical protein
MDDMKIENQVQQIDRSDRKGTFVVTGVVVGDQNSPDYVSINRFKTDTVPTEEGIKYNRTAIDSTGYDIRIGDTRVRATFDDGKPTKVDTYKDGKAQSGTIRDAQAVNAVRDAFEVAAQDGVFSANELATLRQLSKSLADSPKNEAIRQPTYRCPEPTCKPQKEGR